MTDGYADFLETLPARLRSCLRNCVSTNALERYPHIPHAIDSFAKLADLTDAELLRIPNFGKVSLRQLRAALAARAGEYSPESEALQEDRLIRIEKKLDALLRSFRREYPPGSRGGSGLRRYLFEYPVHLQVEKVAAGVRQTKLLAIYASDEASARWEMTQFPPWAKVKDIYGEPIDFSQFKLVKVDDV